jgi:hypothetical protein
MNKAAIEEAIANTKWNLGNEILYRLCREYPMHTEQDVVIAKIWLIGRSYAAPIERRRKYLKIPNDTFYETMVAPKMCGAGIDEWLEGVAEPTGDASLVAHGRLGKLFEAITGLDKRSLASKYLHFHRPESFFLFDSRARQVLARFVRRPRMSAKLPVGCDLEYASFCRRCGDLRTALAELLGRQVTPREVDKVVNE